MLSRPRAAAKRVRVAFDISFSFPRAGSYPAFLLTRCARDCSPSEVLRSGLWRVRPGRGSVCPLLANPERVPADGVSQKNQEVHPRDRRRRHRPERSGGVGRHNKRAEEERGNADDLQPSRKARQDAGAQDHYPEERKSQYRQETQWTKRSRPVRQRAAGTDQGLRGFVLSEQGGRIRLV